MEAILVPSSPDQSISPNYKQIRNPKRNARPLISRPFENAHGGGLLHAPPHSLSFSLPLPINNPLNRHRNHQQKPPLLPLPISQSLPSRSPPTNRKINKSLTPAKKSKPSISPKKSDSRDLKRSSTKGASDIGSLNRLGPDPSDLPENMSRIFSSSSSLETFSGSVFPLISPPPSSLPLPKFSVRPKLSCNAEASGGVDAGATDNLRRLLRLR
ncbi:uncharacterized protein LOC131161458 [Malania oleifera]|uniref:uncharacterized protein LOC131161458 n=1 Tax=Malania oleifera TaxID=397392 RepID=UPI0025AE084F|nr:uncharacterized protein LOC131161458 [Malania oleifera]